MLCIHIGEPTEAKEPVVGVNGVELEHPGSLGIHPGDVLEAVAQPEGTVVMEVVAQEHVVRGGLR